MNSHPIKVNQNAYSEYRVNPPNLPFQNMFLDYMGPFNIKINGKTLKSWILIFMCTWSRAINMKLCLDLSTEEFLRAFQIHVFEYGISEYCVSDLGSQIISGAHTIQDYLKDSDTQNYFVENGIKPILFEQYYKGHS